MQYANAKAIVAFVIMLITSAINFRNTKRRFTIPRRGSAMQYANAKAIVA
ncbi:hypothetical protein PISMIDRAFT_6534 [Pisolithus microcarpus 441]|uniref:Unplaced genomic scaffold scaffold_4, whole genome shotgun sequence n=1 Tax=Pisolithus microcarpus 441 TaxID=765257 RepID=A0A0C9YXA2_9AGAM|nr:hypothetical protein BKA83DRAFT_6534 [Pisolithus microcarpus]KIK29765.1 hypothetical protein PISMIDRAFT_6534 [Pisolithus microcarpus 441]